MQLKKKIRVIVVDDSALVRKILQEIIDRQPDMECIATANDPLIARDLIRNLNPDVITLDIEMPRMDGLDFLGRLMRLRPMPVVMVSTLTQRGAEVTLKALELGAVDFVAKPKIGLAGGLNELSLAIVEKIKIAASSSVRRLTTIPEDTKKTVAVEKKVLSHTSVSRISTEKIICIGSSTGGTEAIKEILIKFPADFPAIVITQHMPAGFTASFAARLNGLCQINVKEAENGERILPGHAYIAPGGCQFHIAKSGANYVCVVDDGPPVNRHKPSVEVLFRSAAKYVGANAIGIMLTGMGNDGAVAMKEMRDMGAYNLAQDEASCIVFGMPREAIQEGAVHEVCSVQQIAAKVMAKLKEDGVSYRI